MYWLRRPPYLRWLAAGLLLVVGLLVETRQAPTESYPFATQSIAAGDPIDTAITWREVPRGLLPRWSRPVRGASGGAIEEGDPLLPSGIAELTLPQGWWSVPIPLPTPAAPGTAVRLVLDNGATFVEGIVVDAGIDDGFETIGMVAFSSADASRVAVAAATDALVVMIGVGTNGAAPSG